MTSHSLLAEDGSKLTLEQGRGVVHRREHPSVLHPGERGPSGPTCQEGLGVVLPQQLAAVDLTGLPSPRPKCRTGRGGRRMQPRTGGRNLDGSSWLGHVGARTRDT